MRRAVLFDLFNTLVPGGADGLRERVLRRMAEVLGVDPDAYLRICNDTWPERLAGGMGDPMTMVGTLARRVGGRPSAEQVARAAALRREMIDGLLAAVPETTLSTLDRVRAAGWLVGLVSNTTRDDPDRFRRSRLAGRFGATVFSSELRVGKPDPKIFLTACDLLGVPPHACVYVGDGGDDELAAAASLGMRAVRTVEHADTVPGWRGPTVRTLAELPSLLAGPHPVNGPPG
ncbi:MAG TPA: HAD family hydrolase [Natronosporangium sp.]|nr:HAD family hydrolase [Natronosporangium sp.]